jgi:hypothetical protein
MVTRKDDPMTNDLTTWLRAQLDDDAQRANEASTQSAWWIDEAGDRFVRDTTRRVIAECPDPDDAAHIAGWGPKRVLAEVDAKRRLIEMHTPIVLRRVVDSSAPQDVTACDYDTDPDGAGWVAYPCETLRLLALPYADRPGHRSEWRP